MEVVFDHGQTPTSVAKSGMAAQRVAKVNDDSKYRRASFDIASCPHALIADGLL